MQGDRLVGKFRHLNSLILPLPAWPLGTTSFLFSLLTLSVHPAQYCHIGFTDFFSFLIKSKQWFITEWNWKSFAWHLITFEVCDNLPGKSHILALYILGTVPFLLMPVYLLYLFESYSVRIGSHLFLYLFIQQTVMKSDTVLNHLGWVLAMKKRQVFVLKKLKFQNRGLERKIFLYIILSSAMC